MKSVAYMEERLFTFKIDDYLPKKDSSTHGIDELSHTSLEMWRNFKIMIQHYHQRTTTWN